MTPQPNKGMNVPESGWLGHGRPGFTCQALRDADQAAADLREISFRARLIRDPSFADEVALMLETVLLGVRQ